MKTELGKHMDTLANLEVLLESRCSPLQALMLSAVGQGVNMLDLRKWLRIDRQRIDQAATVLKNRGYLFDARKPGERLRNYKLTDAGRVLVDNIRRNEYYHKHEEETNHEGDRKELQL